MPGKTSLVKVCLKVLEVCRWGSDVVYGERKTDLEEPVEPYLTHE